MKYLRFKTTDGKYLADLFTSEGCFLGGETQEAEDKAIASHKETLERLYGVKGIAPLTGEADPYDGKATIIPPPPRPVKPPVKTLEQRVAELEALLKK